MVGMYTESCVAFTSWQTAPLPSMSSGSSVKSEFGREGGREKDFWGEVRERGERRNKGNFSLQVFSLASGPA